MEFQKLNRLLISSAIGSVIGAKRQSHVRLIEKFKELEFVTQSAVKVGEVTEIKLRILDDAIFGQYLAGEANRFLLASALSYKRATQIQPENASWQTVEHYYAAYYAIHYLLRITGVSLTNLDSTATAAIARSSFPSPLGITIPTGVYTLRYNETSNELDLKKIVQAGGSHKEAWKLWVELVDKLQKSASADIEEYARVSIDLLTHKKFLVRSQGVFNPPELRGEINYQFKGGSWLFESGSEKSIRCLQRNVGNLVPSLSGSEYNAESLVENNKVLIGLALSVFQHSSEKYPASICRSLRNKYKAYFQ